MSDDMGTRDEMPQPNKAKRSIAELLDAIDSAIIDLNWHMVMETPFASEDLEQLTAMSRILPLTARLAEVIGNQQMFVDRHGVKHVVYKPSPEDLPIWASPGYDLARKFGDGEVYKSSPGVESAIRYISHMFPLNMDPVAESYPSVSETTGEKTVIVMGGHTDYLPLPVDVRFGLLGVGLIDDNPASPPSVDLGNDAHSDPCSMLFGDEEEVSLDTQVMDLRELREALDGGREVDPLIILDSSERYIADPSGDGCHDDYINSSRRYYGGSR